MEPKIKIVLINHTYQINYYTRRWQLLAERHPDIDVTLLAPSKIKWYHRKDYSYGESKTMKGKEVNNGNFHIRLFRPAFSHTWLSFDFKKLLLEIKPDLVYHVGFHTQPTLVQIGRIVHKYLPNTKLALFSMRGPAFNLDKMTGLKRFYSKLVVKYVNKHYDAIFCHYPDAVDCFRKEGYKGPIYMQTQVGVNEEWFHEDFDARREIRAKYKIEDDTFVFGSASRFSTDKGIDIILKALPVSGNWKYLMMGSGTEEDKNRLRAIIKERGLQDKVIETGFVDWYDMAKYWNAVDCAIHVPLTTHHWEETFSLSAIQPQITKKPIIGDTSGSVPYQIRVDDLIVPENNVEALANKIQWFMTHKEEAKKIGADLYHKTKEQFEIQHLNDTFYDTIMEDIIPGGYDENKSDMRTYKPKNN